MRWAAAWRCGASATRLHRQATRAGVGLRADHGTLRVGRRPARENAGLRLVGEDPGTLNGNGISTGNFFGATSYTYALGLFGPDTPLDLTDGRSERRRRGPRGELAGDGTKAARHGRQRDRVQLAGPADGALPRAGPAGQTRIVTPTSGTGALWTARRIRAGWCTTGIGTMIRVRGGLRRKTPSGSAAG